MFLSIGELFNSIYSVTIKGGWIFFALGLLYMFYKLYMDFIQIRWYQEQKWVFLKVVVPRENERSPIAFEHVFNQLHSIHTTFSPAEKFLEGQIQIWFTWELTSIGGAIGNYVRILEKHRDTLEAAIYSQFPNAEISETEDYFDKLPPWHPDSAEYDIFGFNFVLKRPKFYPIRTYHDFEHTEAETIVDPITGLWEELGKISSYEMFIMQFLIRPIDDDWKKPGYELVKKLKGVPQKKRPEIVSTVLAPILGPILDIIIRRESPEGPVRRQNDEPPSLMLHLTDAEKQVIGAVETKLSRLSYQVKIQCLYIAPKEKYNPSPVYTAVIGSIKSLASSITNSLKPDTDHWTKVRYWVFREWERPIVSLRLRTRKYKFFRRMRRRFYFHGRPPNYLNSEELATLIHFPLLDVTVPQIEKVSVTKVQPPPELPVVD